MVRVLMINLEYTWYLMLFHDSLNYVASHCLMVSVSIVVSYDVLWCHMMFHGVSVHLMMYLDVSWCLLVYHFVTRCQICTSYSYMSISV